MAGILPTKNANNLKLFLSNSVDSLRNPLKQGISRNHKQGKNFHAKAKLSTPRESKPPRCQAIASLVTSLESLGDEAKWREKKKRDRMIN